MTSTKYIEEAIDKLIDNDGNFSLVQRHWVIEILDDLETSTLQEEFNSFKENRLNKLNSKSPVSRATIVADFKVILTKLKNDKEKYRDNEYNTLVASLNKACACMWAVMILQRLFYYFKSYLNGKVDFCKQIKNYIVSAKSISRADRLPNNDTIVFNEIYQNLLTWNPDNYNQSKIHYIENDDLKYILPIFQLKKLFHLTNLNDYGSNSISNRLEGLSIPLYRKTITKEILGNKVATWLNMDYFYTTQKVLCLLENNKSEPQFEPIFYFYKCLQALIKNQLESARKYINKSFESLNKNFANICIGIYMSYIMGFYIGLVKSIKYNKISKYATYLTPNDFIHNHLIDSLILKGIHKKEVTWSILFASVRLFNYFSYRINNLKELIFNPFKAVLNALGPFFREVNKLLEGANDFNESKITFLLKQFIPNKSAILKLKVSYLDINIIGFLKHIHYYFNLYNELGLYEFNPNEPLIDYLCNPTIDSQSTISILLNYLESE